MTSNDHSPRKRSTASLALTFTAFLLFAGGAAWAQPYDDVYDDGFTPDASTADPGASSATSTTAGAAGSSTSASTSQVSNLDPETLIWQQQETELKKVKKDLVAVNALAQQFAARFRTEPNPSPVLLLAAADTFMVLKTKQGYDEARKCLMLALASMKPGPQSAPSVVQICYGLIKLIESDGYEMVLEKKDLGSFDYEIAKLLSDRVSVSSPKSYPLAYWSGKLFHEHGDFIWAAAMYRRCLKLDGVGEELKSQCRKGLAGLKLNEVPDYPVTVNVSSEYIKDASVTNHPAWKEEYLADQKTWASILAIVDRLAPMSASQPTVPVKNTDITEFKNSLKKILGVEFNRYRPLYLQTYCYKIRQLKGPDSFSYAKVLALCDEENLFKGLSIQPAPHELPEPMSKDDPLWVGYFKNLTVKYLKSEAERLPYKLTFDPKKKLLQRNKEVFTTQKLSTVFSGDGWGIYVLSPDGELLVSSHARGRFHHSSLIAAAPAAGAGEIKADNGVITEISNKSGHYLPTVIQLVQTLKALEKMGVDLSKITTVQVMGLPKGTTAAGKAEQKKWLGTARDLLDMWNKKPADFKTAYLKMGFSEDALKP
ncbi:hypothetical protein [Phragmitibacter flavus]|nr:hypothetical protein [Phragmitibacter flavus]